MRYAGLLQFPVVIGMVAGGSAGACYDCTIQGRFMEYRASDTAAGATTEAYFELNETRGSEEAHYTVWHVRIDPPPDSVTAVRLRAGTVDAPGAVLYEFAIVNAVPAAGVITQVFNWTPYAGEIPFDELWDRIQGEPTVVEVLLDGDAAPIMIGPLQLTNARDWQDILCS